MSISICIPTYNRLPHLKRLLVSIFDGFGDYPYEVIIADGGSTDGTTEYLKKINNIILIEQKELTGAVKAFNACFKLAKYDYIFWATDDFIILPEVLKKACNLMDDHKDIGLVAPKMQEPTVGNLPGVDLVIHSLVLSKTYVCRTSILKEINYFDENFRMYGVDNDSCLSILNKGYTIIFTRDVGVIHNRLKDNASILTHKKEIIQKDRKYFKKKWASLDFNINKYLSLRFFKNYKYKLLRFFSRGIKTLFYLKVDRFIPKNGNYLIKKIYDNLLRHYIFFEAKEYNNLKDFYLAQRFPKEILNK